jgi:hypothetical protein
VGLSGTVEGDLEAPDAGVEAALNPLRGEQEPVGGDAGRVGDVVPGARLEHLPAEILHDVEGDERFAAEPRHG